MAALAEQLDAAQAELRKAQSAAEGERNALQLRASQLQAEVRWLAAALPLQRQPCSAACQLENRLQRGWWLAWSAARCWGLRRWCPARWQAHRGLLRLCLAPSTP